jgi:acyl-CoA synthetase (AMP-forming)/AMP-acid ligase II
MAADRLIDRFFEAAGRRPEQLALLEITADGDRPMGYGELAVAVRRLAWWLRQQDLQTGARIGIHLPNSLEYVVAYYAAWTAGLVPVALNTQATPHELSAWVGHSGCALLFSRQDPDRLGVQAPVCRLSVEASAAVAVDGDILPDSALDEVIDHEIASLIYTSGTTGAPKGITLGHDNLGSNIAGVIESLSILPDDRFLCVLPFYYSFGNSILHSHLSLGATLVLLDPAGYPVRILEAIEQHHCQGFAGVPSLYLSLLKKTDFTKHDLGSLRYLTQAGGPLAVEFIRELLDRLPGVRLYVMYGQTECSARIACLPPDRLDDKFGSVGRPIRGLEIRVVDQSGVPCAAGEQGEICVRGPSIMRGYWQDPERTGQVLRDGWLHTGDHGYLDEDGFLFIVGRQTEMLKIADNRVSPYEIEEVILELPGVEECAVVGCEHQLLGQAAHAAIVASDPGLTAQAVKKHCKQQLAFYKIPKTIAFVDALPKTSSGKIRRGEIHCPNNERNPS